MNFEEFVKGYQLAIVTGSAGPGVRALARELGILREQHGPYVPSRGEIAHRRDDDWTDVWLNLTVDELHTRYARIQ